MQPSVIAGTSTLRRGGILNSPETSVTVALAEGRCTRLSGALAVLSGSLIRLQWAENVKLNKADSKPQTGAKHCF